MDKEFQTSFIPKKPLNEERVVTRRPVSLVNFVVTIIFIGSLVAAGGAYAYELTLKKSVANMDEQLNLARSRFEPTLIADMQLLDKRLHAADQILSNHVIVSPLFQSLQALTLKSVSFTKFSYKITSDSGKPAVEISMTGKATGYDAIALQSDALATNKYIKDPVFSNLNLDEKARVTFDLSFIVDPTFLNYKDTITREGVAATENMINAQTPAPDATTPTNNDAGLNFNADAGATDDGGTTGSATGAQLGGVPLPDNLGTAQ